MPAASASFASVSSSPESSSDDEAFRARAFLRLPLFSWLVVPSWRGGRAERRRRRRRRRGRREGGRRKSRRGGGGEEEEEKKKKKKKRRVEEIK